MRQTEQMGLGLAVLGHMVLLGVLSFGLNTLSDKPKPSEPITVTLADDIALASMSPQPFSDPATSVAPEVGDMTEPEPAPESPPDMAEPEQAEPTPAPRETPKPSPAPKPKPKATVKPKPKPAEKPKPKPAAKPQPAKTPPKEKAKPRGSRLGDDFLKGVSDQPSTSTSQSPPAAKAGPAVVASLQRELLRQVKPKWTPPTGADADKLRTTVIARLDTNGRIIGTPKASTTGITASNRAQVQLHQERAIRAVTLAAPFQFPDEYYAEWKVIEPVLYLGL